jgi:UDP:flavonoid glycosyltransferase YjiC (YdhE family)
MRVFFTCVIGYGHFHPMLPLARAFEAAGHAVAFATDPGFSPSVAAAGFNVFPAGLDHRVALSRFIATMPDWPNIPHADHMTYLTPGMFARVRVPPMLIDLDPLIRDWRPDLIVHESGEMAGAIAAAGAGIAHAELALGLLRPFDVRSRATDALAPISEERGFRNPGVGGIAGELYLDICPPGFQHTEIADVPNVAPLRPLEVAAEPDAAFATWADSMPSRPTVYVTLGTIFNNAEVFRTILADLICEPLNVIVTVGSDGDPALLGPQPENVYVERFIPQAQVLARSDVLVSHGGSGAMLGAMNAAVPILAIPQGADQFMNAKRIVDTGLGLRLLPDEVTPWAVRDRAVELLDDDRFVTVARSLRREIDGMPAPAAVVENLADFAKRRPAARRVP